MLLPLDHELPEPAVAVCVALAPVAYPPLMPPSFYAEWRFVMPLSYSYDDLSP